MMMLRSVPISNVSFITIYSSDDDEDDDVMLAPHHKHQLDKIYGVDSKDSDAHSAEPAQHPKKVWATLITNTKYLTGLLALDYSLKKAGSRYPLLALYTETFPPEARTALKARGILSRPIAALIPSVPNEYADDPRFYDTWSKLAVFSLTEYDRVVLLDSDMLVFQNMDELMEMELDPPKMAGDGNRVYAASHACACNPLKRPHYPRNWIPENCAFTAQHDRPDEAQKIGSPATAGIATPNGGLIVCNPSRGAFDKIVETLKHNDITAKYLFPDQDLLGELFYGRWVGLPYIYNALKTLRRKGVHDAIWRDDQVKNLHYILSPKPWEESPDKVSDETHVWWHQSNQQRLEGEKARGIDDGF